MGSARCQGRWAQVSQTDPGGQAGFGQVQASSRIRTGWAVRVTPRLITWSAVSGVCGRLPVTGAIRPLGKEDIGPKPCVRL